MAQKKKQKDKAARTERTSRSDIDRLKSELAVNVIQYNHAIGGLMKEIGDVMRRCRGIVPSFGTQKALLLRARMQERLLNTVLRVLDDNKMQLWMIDDGTIEEDSRR